MSPSLLLVLLASTLAYVSGIAMLRAGRWRGVNHRQCMACGYDLTGLEPRREAPCPECGVRLTRKTAQWAMGRQQRNLLNVAGVVLVVCAGVVLACSVITLFMAVVLAVVF